MCVLPPFLTQDVYQTSGDNIDAFVIPPASSELRSYLESNYSGPEYYTLVLPLSSLPESQVVLVNNQSFDDSTFLLAAYIPYPIYWTDNERFQLHWTTCSRRTNINQSCRCS